MSTVAEQLAIAIAPDVTRRVLAMPADEIESIGSLQGLGTRQQVVGWLVAQIVGEILANLRALPQTT